MRTVTVVIDESFKLDSHNNLKDLIGGFVVWEYFNEEFRYLKIIVSGSGNVLARYYKDEACQNITYSYQLKAEQK
jgi:hypothetical protein